MPGKKGITSRLLHTVTRKPLGVAGRSGRKAPNYDHGMCTANDDFTPDEVEFMMAMDKYKREKRRPYPTWHEVLAVLKSLGYRKVPPCSSNASPKSSTTETCADPP